MLKRKLPFIVLLVGNLAMSYGLFTHDLFTTPEYWVDFLKGFGLSLIIGSFILMLKKKYGWGSYAKDC